MTKDLRNGEIELFMNRLEAFFAGMPYIEGKAERYEQFWQREIYLIFRLMGERVACQPHTATGRADCIVETKQYVYIFEFKMDQNAEEALQQIDERVMLFHTKRIQGKSTRSMSVFHLRKEISQNGNTIDQNIIQTLSRMSCTRQTSFFYFIKQNYRSYSKHKIHLWNTAF